MLVIDTSALLLAVSDPRNSAATHIKESGDLHAPHIIDIEFIHVVRRLLANKQIDEVEADQLITTLNRIPIERYPHQPFAKDIWKLRNNLTPYDASFVVLAARLGAKLLTADKKMSKAPIPQPVDFILVEN